MPLTVNGIKLKSSVNRIYFLSTDDYEFVGSINYLLSATYCSKLIISTILDIVKFEHFELCITCSFHFCLYHGKWINQSFFYSRYPFEIKIEGINHHKSILCFKIYITYFSTSSNQFIITSC